MKQPIRSDAVALTSIQLWSGRIQKCEGVAPLLLHKQNAPLNLHVPGGVMEEGEEKEEISDQFLKTTLVSNNFPVTGLVSCSDNQRSIASL